MAKSFYDTFWSQGSKVLVTVQKKKVSVNEALFYQGPPDDLFARVTTEAGKPLVLVSLLRLESIVLETISSVDKSKFLGILQNICPVRYLKKSERIW